MKIYKCDRCDTEFATERPLDPPTPKGDASVNRGATTPAPIVKEGNLSWVKADLCGGCVQSLAKWFNIYKS